MTAHRGLVAGSIRGVNLQAQCVCGWRGEVRPKYGTAKAADGRTVTAAESGIAAANAEIEDHVEAVAS